MVEKLNPKKLVPFNELIISGVIQLESLINLHRRQEPQQAAHCLK
jgi:hypothetical protein